MSHTVPISYILKSSSRLSGRAHLRLSMAMTVFSAALVLFAYVLAFSPSLADGFITRPYLPEPAYADGALTDFYRFQLSREERVEYDKAEYTLRTLGTEIRFDSPLTREEVARVLASVRADNPDIFWMSNTFTHVLNADDEVVKVRFRYQYDDPAEIIQRHASYVEQAEQCVSDTLLAVQQTASQKQEAQLLYELVLAKLQYGHTDHDQNIDAFFGEDGYETVCSGYARSFQLLCDMAGIPCIYVAGTTPKSSGNGHAWNMCVLDGATYYVDSAWGDAFTTSNAYFTEDAWIFGREHIFGGFFQTLSETT